MKKNIYQFNNMIKDPNRKKIFNIIKETIQLSKEYKLFPSHYFTRLGYKKNQKKFKNYVDNKTIAEIHNSSNIHRTDTISLLEDKVKFYKFCINNNIATSKVIGLNNQNQFRDEKQNKIVRNKNEFKKVLQEMLNKNKSVFAKPLDGIQGKGCFKINRKLLENEKKISEMYITIVNSNYIFQETIIQHSALNNINPYSINTIRIDTYIDKNSTLEVMSALIRFGRAGSVVDNPNESGGFFVPINLKNGKLKIPGMQLLRVGNTEFYKHPDTNYNLENFQIPYFKESIELVEKAAKILGHKLVGWDIAITEKGPLIIEGNHNYHIGMQDAAFPGYRTHPVFKKIIEEI